MSKTQQNKKLSGLKKHAFFISEYSWFRNPGTLQVSALFQNLVRLQSRCQQGLHSYLKM